MLLCLDDDVLSYVVVRVDADDLLPFALACTRLRDHCTRRANTRRQNTNDTLPLWTTAATKSMSRLGWALMLHAKPSSAWCVGAARYGQVAVLRWLEEGGYLFSARQRASPSYSKLVRRVTATAASRGHVVILAFLDERGLLCRCDEFSAWAIKRGHSAALQFLIGCSPGRYSPCDPDRLMCDALNSGYVRMVEQVHQTLNVSLMLKFENGVNAAHIAAGCNHAHLLAWLHSAGGLSLQAVDDERRSCLHHAAYTGAVDSVTWLLKQGVEVDARNITGKTALMSAVAGDDDVIVLRLLLDAHADPDAVDTAGWTALMYCTLHDKTERVVELLRAGADVNRVSLATGSTALLIACAYDCDILALLDARADVNAALNDGCTPLMFCAHTGDTARVRALIAAGAAVHAQNRDGETALSRARDQGHTDCVALLTP